MYEYEQVIFQLLTQIFCTMSEVTQTLEPNYYMMDFRY
jgi:hypothetical protein